jgi:puromycin-sensitive aminopeptidase
VTTSPGNDADHRLPRHALPRRYRLRLAPDLEAARFDGEARVELELTTPADEIVLNAAELHIDSASLVALGTAGGGDGEVTLLAVHLDPERERVSFRSPRRLEAGPYELRCRFGGVLNDRLRGFYRSRFRGPDGSEQVLAVTQFESTDARRAFPCFDEPDMKAVFEVELDVPEGLCALSNAGEVGREPSGPGRVLVRFAPTMPMSTYLVAFVVGRLEATDPVVVNGVPVRVVHVPGRAGLGGFALEAAAHALAFYEAYFGLPYPGDKLDLVAIPDFAAGAMENLGCVTFRETALLADPEDASPEELERIAEVVEHEIAHMWFGDLVTMRWWNGIWLNEAFATFMALHCLDDFRPEWRCWTRFGRDREAAMAVDGLHATRPIEFPVRSPDEAEAMFDLLTYEKGASVLRMAERFLGAERYREGIRSYLAAHRHGNTETGDLWAALEGAAPDAPVRQMMEGWVFQGGYPLVELRLTPEGALELVQRPFAYLEPGQRDPAAPASAIGSNWLVPVLLVGRDPGLGAPEDIGAAEAGARRVLLGAQPSRVERPAGVVVANAGGAGFYRTLYCAELLADLLSHLGRLETLERIELVADLWAAVLAGLRPLDDIVELAGRLAGEDDPSVWGVVVSALTLLDRAVAEHERPVLEGYVRSLLGPELERTGFDPVPGESDPVARRRALLVRALGTIGADPAVRERCAQSFAAEQAGGRRLPPDLAAAVLAVVASRADEATFEAILSGYRAPKDPLDEQRRLRSLAAVTDPGLVARVHDLSLTEVRTQDAPYLLLGLLANRDAGPATWAFVASHFSEIRERFPVKSIPRLLEGVAALVHLDPDGRPLYAEEVRSFLRSQPFGGEQRLVEQSLERLAVNLRFAQSWRGRIAPVLERAAVAGVPRGTPSAGS